MLLVLACSTTKSGKRYTRDEMSSLLARLETVSLELGEFPIEGGSAVVDGDTLRVRGLDSTLRLLVVDTEETFKHEDERRAYDAGWDQYKKSRRGDSQRPVKFATPMGDDAKAWAQEFFKDVISVRLERDHPGEIRDYYGRYLAYVMVKKDGTWLNYNLELVRHGWSPYFVKYGRSRRFHKQFLEAQGNAKAAKIGIWDPKKQHYDDYAERLKWWGDREAAISRFEKAMEEHPTDYIALTRWDAPMKLEQKMGKEVTLLGAVSEVKLNEKGPSLVRLSRNRGNDFDVVFWDKDVLIASGAQYKKGEYIQVRGLISKYRDEHRGADKLELVVSMPGQVLAPSPELQQLLADENEKSSKASTEGD